MSAPPSGPLRRGLLLLLAMAAAAAGLMLALHYPVHPTWMALIWTLTALLCARCDWAPFLLPGLLPVLGFAPWTGWVTFEELDLLVLAIAAGGYAGLAFDARPRPPVGAGLLRWSALSRLMIILFVVSLLTSIWRGIDYAGGFHWGWWQGYREPMNAWRQGKSFFLLLLLLPLWRRLGARDPLAAKRWLGLAPVLALVLASLAAVWERAAFPGLLDFSQDYRSTALFWETHVGGAPFDACLALCVPFSLAWVWRERRPAPFALAVLALLLAGYTVLTTFSRGLYLGAPLGGALTLLLLALQPGGRPAEAAVNKSMSGPMRRRRAGLLTLVVIAFGAAALPLFVGGGYRALLGLMGSASLVLATPPNGATATRGQRLLLLISALMVALLAAALGWVASAYVPKFVYVLTGAVTLTGLALSWLWRSSLRQRRQLLALDALWLLSLLCVGMVATHWGGDQALWHAEPPLLLLGLAGFVLHLLPSPWPSLVSDLSWRARAVVAAACMLLAATIAIAAGGAYLMDRLSTGEEDLQGRITHWHVGLSLLRGPEDWLVGKGTGTFVDAFYFGGPTDELVGDYRLHEDGVEPYLALTGGLHTLGWGEMFRVSQRIAPPHGKLRVVARVRTAHDATLHVEICEKHLLYNGACLLGESRVRALADHWQDLSIDLGDAPPMGGNWWAPRLVAFAMAMETPGARLDIEHIQVLDSEGRGLLNNADFSNGMARWFFSSDKFHMPWHMKNLPLHMLFEQGLVGLGLALAMWAGALWRTSLGSARGRELAPPLAGALLGFAIVGMFDSVIDAPRLGFMFFSTLVLALGLREKRGGEAVRH